MDRRIYYFNLYMMRNLNHTPEEWIVEEEKLREEFIKDFGCHKKNCCNGKQMADHFKVAEVADYWLEKIREIRRKEVMEPEMQEPEEYYCKARTENGILVFKTKEDFDKWRGVINNLD